MERSLLREMNKRTMEAYMDKQREAFLNQLFWMRYFPLKWTNQLTWESLSGSGGNPVMADVIEYNASAPLKSRRIITKKTGDIPKIALKRKMDEKDYNDYNTLAVFANDANRSALLDLVFGDVDFCYSAVMARTEYLCGQALSYGQIVLDSTNNNGIITETNADFGIPAANKTGAAVTWATAATATPIQDIMSLQDKARANGHTVRIIIMDRATLVQMLATTEVRDKYAVFQQVTTSRKTSPTFDDLNRMLEGYMLPTIQLWDSAVRHETLAHALSTLSPWKAGYVTLLSEQVVGDVMHGPIAEETAATVQKKAIMVKRDHVLISKWSDLEPFGEFTKGQANAFPRFRNVDSIYMLNTANASTWV